MTNLRRLRIEQVVDKVAMPKSTIYDKIRAGTKIYANKNSPPN